MEKHRKKISSYQYNDRYEETQKIGGATARFYPRKPSRHLIQFLLENKAEKGLSVIFGAGEGRSIQPLIDDGWNVVALDNAEAAIQRAKLDYKKNERVKYLKFDLRQDIESIIVPNSVDLVVIIQILHMFIQPDDRDMLLKNAYKILRPGGYCFLENNGDFHASETVYLNLDNQQCEQRTIETENGLKIIKTPRFPTVMLNKVDSETEFNKAGFEIEKISDGAFNHPDTVRKQIWSILKKPT